MGESFVKDGKVMLAISSPTIRGIVAAANSLSIQREDIICLTREGNEFVLIYYGGQNYGGESC